MVTGSFKFIIRDAKVRDLTGSVGQTDATGEGLIVAAWNPDEVRGLTRITRMTRMNGRHG